MGNGKSKSGTINLEPPPPNHPPPLRKTVVEIDVDPSGPVLRGHIATDNGRASSQSKDRRRRLADQLFPAGEETEAYVPRRKKGKTKCASDGLSVVHEVDSKEGDRKKFYHETVLKEKRPVSSKENDRYDVFLKWVKENGAKFPGQYLKKYSEDVRGVHASVTVPAESQIATVPLKLLIHEGMGQLTDVGSRVRAAEHELIVPNHTFVIIYLLETGARYWAKPGRRCTSFFKPYYDILPRSFDSFPIFWTEDEIKWLEGSVLQEQIRDRKENILFDYYEVCRICPDFRDRFDEDDFLWCRTAVGSRNFGITINGVKRTTMVPWADMLNHYRPRETSWTFSDSQQAFTMTALSDLIEGQQVMDSYGKKCNSKFFMHYGFAVENNIEADGRCMNEVLVMLEIPALELDQHLNNQRIEILHAADIHARITMSYNDAATAELLSFARVTVANQVELEEMFARGHAQYPIHEHPVEPVCPRNELAALALLARECRYRLTQYPTTLEEDLDMLKNGGIPPFSNRRNALIVVKSEKQVLHHYVRLSELIAPLFQTSTTAIKDYVTKTYTGKDDASDAARYLKHVVKKLEEREEVLQDY
jgi:protein-histidine N-methyltransferase